MSVETPRLSLMDWRALTLENGLARQDPRLSIHKAHSAVYPKLWIAASDASLYLTFAGCPKSNNFDLTAM